MASGRGWERRDRMFGANTSVHKNNHDDCEGISSAFFFFAPCFAFLCSPPSFPFSPPIIRKGLRNDDRVARVGKATRNRTVIKRNENKRMISPESGGDG